MIDEKARDAAKNAREQYRQAIEALGDPAAWRNWRQELNRQAMIRELHRNRVGRRAGRAMLAAAGGRGE
jgi:hypothetical protein